MAQEMSEPLAAEPAISSGARLRAEGSAALFLDGPHRLVFDYEALEQLEEDFVDLETVVARLQESGYASKRLQFLRRVLAAATVHEKPEPMSFAEWSVRVRKNLLVRELPRYLDALIYAVAEAFPEFVVEDAGGPKEKGARSSRGNGSTSLQPASSGARRGSSGG